MKMTYNEHGTNGVVPRLFPNEFSTIPKSQGICQVYHQKGQTHSAPAHHGLANTNLFSVYQISTISTNAVYNRSEYMG